MLFRKLSCSWLLFSFGVCGCEWIRVTTAGTWDESPWPLVQFPWVQNWGFTGPPPPAVSPSSFLCVAGGWCPGLLGGTGQEGPCPAWGPLPFSQPGAWLFTCSGKGQPCLSSPEPRTSRWVSSWSRWPLSPPHCISWEGLGSPCLSVESLLRWGQRGGLAGQLPRDLKDGHLLEGGLGRSCLHSREWPITHASTTRDSPLFPRNLWLGPVVCWPWPRSRVWGWGVTLLASDLESHN